MMRLERRPVALELQELSEVLYLEEWVGGFFQKDSGSRPASEVVAWPQARVIGQLPEKPLEALVLLPGILVAFGAADLSHEEEIARDGDLFSGQMEDDVVGGMSWKVKDLDAQGPQRDGLAVI